MWDSPTYPAFVILFAWVQAFISHHALEIVGMRWLRQQIGDDRVQVMPGYIHSSYEKGW
jgi:hypothetical protein